LGIKIFALAFCYRQIFFLASKKNVEKESSLFSSIKRSTLKTTNV